uniref:Class II aldolase/adducin N-terminal domain-containing protein n=2 Tax=Bionectria ochroleuca TaxID=29856 RepID=A0A8H7KAA5_BIOOC
MAATESNALLLQAYSRKFIHGCHILHQSRVLDAFGHLSFRHPSQHDVFIMSLSAAPGTISSPKDLIAYRVSDAEPLESTPYKGYEERRIHSEIYKLHKDVNAIVHSHSEAVVPYTISNAPLRACYHMAGFLGVKGAAVFDIAEHRDPALGADMLVRTEKTGSALARTFDETNRVTLMRGHGFTLIADSIEMAVMWAIYTQKNALIQTTAATLQSLYGPSGSANDLLHLDDEEASLAEVMTKRTVQRPWQLWVREVEACGLYVNTA